MINYKCLIRATIISAFLSNSSIALFAAGAVQSHSLKLYHIHTHEKAEIVFWSHGHFDKAGLKKLNHFLRDWRSNEETVMNPKLFNLIWKIYRLSGSKDYIHVVSAYRTAATNKMLRNLSKYSGVAKHSQHILGKAMDIYLPDIALVKLHKIALKLRGGGVGYYPHSKIPFVHVDVGPIRKWTLTSVVPNHKADRHGH
ncbi:MAG: DUF882 domain-containing protein [Alphaproteobacteria bacterium]|nr:DUF882 domain-containing protein [Alphaproteobacteria bacterium]